MKEVAISATLRRFRARQIPRMSSDAELRVESDLQRLFQERLPSASVIAELAVRKAMDGHEEDPAWLKEHFSALVDEVQVAAVQEYVALQQTAVRLAFGDVLLPLAGQNATAGDLINVLADNFGGLERFFASLAQGRKPHAGKAFEMLVARLFSRHYAYAQQPILKGQPDFVFPSVEHFRSDPNDSLVFSVKKTIRERWRQMVTTMTKPLGYFVATTDEDVPAADLAEMHTARMYMVVPTRVKRGRVDYDQAGNVMTFEHFFAAHLDPAVERWKAAKVIRADAAKEHDFRQLFAPKPEPRPSVFSTSRTTARLMLRLQQGSLFD